MGEQKHPKGLGILFFTEMWERFSFYLMLGILYQYLSDSQKGGMALSDQEAAVIVGSYIALVYFTPFIGGLLADRLLGCRKTIVIGGLLMMMGHLTLAWPTALGLYLGLGLLILGNGAFKPNISTLVGNLYPPGSPLKDAGYNIFYMGINIGAFLCNFVAAFVRNYVDEHPIYITSEWEVGGWHAAFATAAVGMLFAVLLFSVNYHRFEQADQRPEAEETPRESLTPLWIQCLLPAAILGTLGWVAADWAAQIPSIDIGLNPPTAAFIGACIPVIIFYLNIMRKIGDPHDRGRVAALLVIFGVVIVFWMTFMLSSTALTAWIRDDTDRVPSAAVRFIEDRLPDVSENAPASYYFNADPEVPRPSRDTFEVVSKEEYNKLKDAKKLGVKEGEKIYVTQDIMDKVYANTTSATPLLEPGKHLKLVNPELFLSINGGYIIILTPLVVAFWHWLRLRGKEPSTSAKIGWGLILTAGSALIMLLATLACHDGETKASAWWMFGTYLVITLGELCLSPMGLSLVNKMAPANIRAFMMGGWFLATSLGNKLSGIFGEIYFKMDHRLFWIVLIGCNLAFGAIIFTLLPWLNRQMASSNE
jgi:POT family proton-dependent oligopeptide transporter